MHCQVVFPITHALEAFLSGCLYSLVGHITNDVEAPRVRLAKQEPGRELLGQDVQRGVLQPVIAADARDKPYIQYFI
jgi:hypothetical protein